MKNATLSMVLLCFYIFEPAFAKVEAVLGPIPLQQNVNLAVTPTFSAENEILISRDQYVISYNRNRRSLNWVAWKLEAKNIGSVQRTNNFAKDADLDKYLARVGGGAAVDSNEYQGSCFDRGHQIPSKDRTDSVENNDQTFLMSNMIPQTPFLNRVIWEHLEQHTRDLVQTQHKKIYVIAGPVYDQNFGYIGPHKDIPVPSKDFKILVVLNSNQTPADITAKTEVISVLMPNVLQDGSMPKPDSKDCLGFNLLGVGTSNDWEKYKTTVGEIESLSGITFGRIHFH